LTPPDLATPSTFGDFELIAKIAEGGMAEIFRARHPTIGRGTPVVIKRLLPHLATNRTLIDLLVSEARITALLSHPNIVEVLEHGQIDGHHYICLELVEGPDLLALLEACTRAGQRLPVKLALFITRTLCEALDHAHNARDPLGRPLRIIHRDISPSNVLLTPDGTVKLMDFGVARAELGLTAPERERGGLRGKIGYMSPEQVESRPFDERADLFALGVLLFEMLTLKRLFVGRTEVQTLMNIRACDLEPRLARHDYLPAAVSELLRGALARDPADRLPSARAFGAAIDALMQPRLGRQRALRDLIHALIQSSQAPERPEDATTASSDRLAMTLPAELGSLSEVTADASPAVSAPQSLHVRNRDGSLFGPIDLPHLVQLAQEYAVHPDDLVSADGGEWQRLRDLTDLDTTLRLLLSDPPVAPILEGPLDPLAAPSLLLRIASARLTGCLRLSARETRKHLFFASGRPLAAFSTLKTDLFGAWLVASGRVPANALDETLEDPAHASLPLGQRLVASGALTLAQLELALGAHLEARLREALDWRDGWFEFIPDLAPPRSIRPELAPDLIRLVIEHNAHGLSSGALERLFAPVMSVALRPPDTEPRPQWLVDHLHPDQGRIARYLLTAGATLANCPGPLHARLRVALLLRNAGLLALSL
jgi:serine/threonine protein kinase